MNQLFTLLANIVGIFGILVCLVSGLTRITGNFYLFGYEAMTLFMGGTALMVMACLLKLHQLTEK